MKMNNAERMVIGKNMAKTLAKLNEFFEHKETMSKDEFMDTQQDCWNEKIGRASCRERV